MIRKFRAIVETPIEPEDHNVLWYYQGNILYFGNESWEPLLDIDASEIVYENEDDPSITTIKEALDKLLYEPLVIKKFNLIQGGTHERGVIISTLDFSWEYNKSKLRSQTINGTSISSDLRNVSFDTNIDSNSTFTLIANDGKTTARATSDIRFTEFIYYGTKLESTEIKRLKIQPNISTITIVAGTKEYIWIFIPKSTGYTKIWHNNVDSTEDFIKVSDYVYTADTNAKVLGTLYVSKNHSLNDVTLKFT